jgi:hypothetical protein
MDDYTDLTDRAAHKRAQANEAAALRSQLEEIAEQGDDRRARRAGKLAGKLQRQEHRHLGAAEDADSEARHLDERMRLREAERHESAAEGISLMRAKNAESMDGALRRAEKLLMDSGGRMADSDWAAYRGSLRSVDELHRISASLAEIEARERRRAAHYGVTGEARVYGPDSPYSFYLDRCTVAFPDQPWHQQGASERLERYAAEVAVEVRRKSAEGRRAERLVREATRAEDEVTHEQRHRDLIHVVRGDAELRAAGLGTGGGATVSATSGAAAFVVPFFLLDEWAPYRGVYRTFADQCHSWPCPEWGMQVAIPYFSTADAAAQQTELSGVSETDPTTAFQTGTLQTVSGQVTLTQQAHDRGYVGGGSLDQVIARELQQRLDEKIDVYTLTTVIAAAGTVSGASSYSTANLYSDLASGREGITDTAGVRLRPTHLFTTSDLYSYVSRQVDDQHRPIVTPKFAPGLPFATGADDGRNGGADAPKWARFTGTVLPAGVLWFEDDNIPASGSNTQLLVSAPDQAVVLVEGEPILSVFPETFAPSLDVVLNLRAYVTAITRHASGTQAITGNAYPLTAK